MPRIIALVGKPNVGKSTLFNLIVGVKDAIIDDAPCVTRDRRYGKFKDLDVEYCLVDTGGVIFDVEKDSIDESVQIQTQYAISEADMIFFVVDVLEGLGSLDFKLAERLRPYAERVLVVANKSDNERLVNESFEAYRLGFKNVISASAIHGIGMKELFNKVREKEFLFESDEITENKENIRVTIFGGTNVGKSTFVNAILNRNRVIVSDQAGTTMESIDVVVDSDKKYIMTDTAGLRKFSKKHKKIDKVSTIKSIESMQKSDVVLVVVDSNKGITEQDLRIIGKVVYSGKAFIILLNKMDLLDSYKRNLLESDISRKLRFVEYIPRVYVSAKKRCGIKEVFKIIEKVYLSSTVRPSTSHLNKLLMDFLIKHPLHSSSFVTKLKYAHIGGINPYRIIIHGTNVGKLSKSYKMYLQNCFRKNITNNIVPLSLIFKES